MMSRRRSSSLRHRPLVFARAHVPRPTSHVPSTPSFPVVRRPNRLDGIACPMRSRFSVELVHNLFEIRRVNVHRHSYSKGGLCRRFAVSSYAP
jgi:hypothetical protein